eukprot:CAMPEP_0173429582 /NCGR_PEP_ID=MMETSP1357-20121228/8248_1 /TAXON_ID=77926 /ORGANISM="Hemiselmis rufescens, Strain PCC563" /LENGTH=208 /DNA_ID=CAMNT_0014393781 /DNA_START=246 /DNA_END=868 /DNA_ORIENTATION=+
MLQRQDLPTICLRAACLGCLLSSHAKAYALVCAIAPFLVLASRFNPLFIIQFAAARSHNDTPSDAFPQHSGTPQPLLGVNADPARAATHGGVDVLPGPRGLDLVLALDTLDAPLASPPPDRALAEVEHRLALQAPEAVGADLVVAEEDAEHLPSLLKAGFLLEAAGALPGGGGLGGCALGHVVLLVAGRFSRPNEAFLCALAQAPSLR